MDGQVPRRPGVDAPREPFTHARAHDPTSRRWSVRTTSVEYKDDDDDGVDEADQGGGS
jgi:hypothetical protein